jgi:hypothetical protein
VKEKIRIANAKSGRSVRTIGTPALKRQQLILS